MFVILPNELYQDLSVIKASGQKEIVILFHLLPYLQDHVTVAHLIASMRCYCDFLKNILPNDYTVKIVEHTYLIKWAESVKAKTLHMYKNKSSKEFKAICKHLYLYESPGVLLLKRELKWRVVNNKRTYKHQKLRLSGYEMKHLSYAVGYVKTHFKRSVDIGKLRSIPISYINAIKVCNGVLASKQQSDDIIFYLLNIGLLSPYIILVKLLDSDRKDVFLRFMSIYKERA